MGRFMTLDSLHGLDFTEIFKIIFMWWMFIHLCGHLIIVLKFRLTLYILATKIFIQRTIYLYFVGKVIFDMCWFDQTLTIGMICNLQYM